MERCAYSGYYLSQRYIVILYKGDSICLLGCPLVMKTNIRVVVIKTFHEVGFDTSFDVN